MIIRKRLRGLILAMMTLSMAFVAYAETVTVSTYYPSPYGSYTNLDTSGDTNLATNAANRVGIGTTAPTGKLDVRGKLCVNNGNPWACPNNTTQAGSLVTGDLNLNYGGGNNWNANTAGILMEALDNTEIAVHDNGQRVASLMYFEGGGNNRITIGRDMAWGVITSVGIGATPAAAYKLDVAGAARVTGVLNLTSAGQAGILQVNCDGVNCYAAYAP